MNEQFLSNFKITVNNIFDTLVDGNHDRKELITNLNKIFIESYSSGILNTLCKIKTCTGNKNFKNQLSAFRFRSGLQILIINDNNLQKNELYIISGIILSNPYFVRKLMSLGYDTLRVNSKGNNIKFDVQLSNYSSIENNNLIN